MRHLVGQAFQNRPLLTWITAASALVVVLGIYVAARGGGPQEFSADIPNCVVGSLKTVGQGTPPVEDTQEWEKMTFSSPEEAAQDAFDRYMAAGRADGRSLGTVSLGVLHGQRYFVPTPDSPERGEVLFGVERVGARYAVLYAEFCDGAEPTVDLFSGK